MLPVENVTLVERSNPVGQWVIFKDENDMFTVWRYPQWGEYGIDPEGRNVGYYTTYERAKAHASTI